MGVTTADDAQARMKKHPSNGAHDRARVLRRQMTQGERRVWQMLRMRQVSGCRFRRQVPIGRYIADFVCHEARLIIEVDGGQHDADSPQEAERSRFLEGQGYRMLRFWNNEVLANPEGILMTIIAALAVASPQEVTPTPPLPHRGGGREVRPPSAIEGEGERCDHLPPPTGRE